VEGFAYETCIPRKFILQDGKIVSLKAFMLEERISEEPLFLLYVPPDRIDKVYTYLKTRAGFEDVCLALPKGEKYSIRKKLSGPWELHLRLYTNGFIEAEVEVQRDYWEHLSEKRRRLFVVYEVFKYYRDIYDKLHIFYKPEEKWVAKVIDNFCVKLRPPRTLTPWRPIITGVVATTTIVFLLLLTLCRSQKRPTA